MSESTVGREPVEIIEIITPKCTNSYGVAPCTASGTRKCFNTRSTCQDVDNFQARPLAHLTPDLIKEDGETITSGSLNLSASVTVKTDVTFSANPTGTIWEQGSSGDGAYLGITGANLVFRAFDGSVSDGAGVAKITTPVSAFAGRTVTLIGSIDIAGTVALWEFDPVEYKLTKIGEDTASSPGSVWSDTFAGEIGGDSGSLVTGEDGGDFNGRIAGVNFYEGEVFNPLADPLRAAWPGDFDMVGNTDYSSTFSVSAFHVVSNDPTSTTLNVPDSVFQSEDEISVTLSADTATEAIYRQRYFFDDGRKAVPSDDIYIVPLLSSADTVGTRINITGVDDRYEPIGRRAYMSVQFNDAPHSDHPFDPYLSERNYDPLTRGTFWTKWLQRNKYGKTRALVRRYTGYDGDALADMERQTYVFDTAKWNGDSAEIQCRDVISLTEFRRAQVPAPSSGKLDAALTDSATTAFLTGDVTDEYPTAGTIRINDELMTYTGRTYDAVDDQTDFTGLTRGTDGSTADAHDVDDGVQLCRRYTAARIDDVLEELFVTDSEVPAQLVDLAKFTSEYEDYLDAYTLTTVISEPTGVDQLVGELAEQCAFYVWWNERRQIVDLQAIRPLIGVEEVLTESGHIIADSFRIHERPKERITTISLYYNPRDFAGDLQKPVNFKNQLVVSNSDAQGLDQYGRLPQTREVFSRWLTTQAMVNQTGSRYSLRYVDVPIYAEFLVDAKDRSLWAGDFVTIQHSSLVDEFGEIDGTRRWLIIEAQEVEAGHSQRLLCADITLDGVVYVIAPNGIGTYTPDLFAAGYAFITDNSGLNPDGTTGATIG